VDFPHFGQASATPWSGRRSRQLSAGPDGRLVYRMKRPKGGSLLLVLTPDELLARLATLVPPPRSHGLRYHGVFAPNAKARARVVPSGQPQEQSLVSEEEASPPAETAAQPSRDGAPNHRPSPAPPRYRVPWAELLQKVFAVDVLVCPVCGGRSSSSPSSPTRGWRSGLLDHLGLDAQGPPLARARAPDDFAEPGPDYGAADPIYDECRSRECASPGGGALPAGRRAGLARSVRGFTGGEGRFESVLTKLL
jgi:Putative transposase